MIRDRFIREQEGVDALEEGYFLLQRRRSQRVDMPVRIMFDAPVDPDTGEALDRSPRWRVLIGGVEVDEEPFWLGGVQFQTMTDFWPRCKMEPIDAQEYEYRMQRQAWASDYDPYDPFGTPGGRINPMTATLPFQD